MAEEMGDLVGVSRVWRRLPFDRLSGGEPRHRAVEMLDSPGDEEVERDAEPEDGDEYANHRHRKLLLQPKCVHRFGEAEIVDQENQRTPIKTQISRSER